MFFWTTGLAHLYSPRNRELPKVIPQVQGRNPCNKYPTRKMTAVGARFHPSCSELDAKRSLEDVVLDKYVAKKDHFYVLPSPAPMYAIA